jgi:hypothetical protein
MFVGLIPLAADIPASSAPEIFLDPRLDCGSFSFLGAGLVGAN